MRFMVSRLAVGTVALIGVTVGGGTLYQAQAAPAHVPPAASAPADVLASPGDRGDVDLTPLPAERMAVLVRFAQCMRDNGVRDYPDPDPQAGAVGIQAPAPGGGNATFLAAVQQCRPLLAPGVPAVPGRK